MTVRQPKPPKGSGVEGRSLWRTIVADVSGQGIELDAREMSWLRHAGKLADRVARLEEALDGADLIVPGHAKQPVANPLLGEVLAARETIRIIGDSHSATIATAMREAMKLGGLDMSADDHALDSVFDHVWKHREYPSGHLSSRNYPEVSHSRARSAHACCSLQYACRTRRPDPTDVLIAKQDHGETVVGEEGRRFPRSLMSLHVDAWTDAPSVSSAAEETNFVPRGSLRSEVPCRRYQNLVLHTRSNTRSADFCQSNRSAFTRPNSTRRARSPGVVSSTFNC
jgi:hypothetical protein